VEKREASFERRGERIALVDLPGTYSLSPYTQEEVVARDYLVEERPDVIIDVVDATNLERNLYLAVQLLELEIPVVVALNIHDEAERMGYRIDVTAMERALGVRIVPTVATKGSGLEALLDAATAAAIPPENAGSRGQSCRYSSARKFTEARACRMKQGTTGRKRYIANVYARPSSVLNGIAISKAYKRTEPDGPVLPILILTIGKIECAFSMQQQFPAVTDRFRLRSCRQESG